MRITYTFSYFIKSVLTALFVLFPLTVLPQETSTCAGNLKNAQALFERGQVEQVPDMLHDCMKSGFTREEELAAYKLLIQSYLFEDELEKADSTMLAFLHKNPEYKLSPTDHSSFVFLYNKFRVKPLIQLSVHLGTNLPFITFIDQHSTQGVPGKNIYSSNALNLFTSLEAKYEISEKLELNVEAGYSQVKFTNVEDFLVFGDTLFGKTTYNETQQRIEVPVTMTYDFKSYGKFTPYGRFGLGSAFTLGSTAKAEHKSTAILGGGPTHTGREVSRTDSRITMDIFVQAGAGIKLKTRDGYINAELRLNAGLMNQTVRGIASETEQDLAGLYYYVDDDFHVNTLNFSIGYTQIFYKPSKRKE
jgi:hypothetical protein